MVLLDTALTSTDSTPTGSTPTGSTPTDRARRWLRPGYLVAAVLLIVGLVAGGLVAIAKTVTIAVDGQTRTVTTLSGSVEGALESADLTVGEHDVLVPAADQPITDGTAITLDRARLFTVTIDGEQVQIWTTADTVEEAFAELGRDPGAYAIADRSRSIPADGLAVTASSEYAVALDIRGDIRTVQTTAATVGELFAAAGLTVGPNDVVTPGLDTPISALAGRTVTVHTLPAVTLIDGSAAPVTTVSTGRTVGDLLHDAGISLGARDALSTTLDAPLTDGLTVTVTRITTSEHVADVEVPQPAQQTVRDATIDKGVTSVEQQGRAGKATVTYEVVFSNGVETGRTEVARTVTVEALPAVVRLGTKAAPVAAPAPTPAAPAAQPAPAPSSGVQRSGSQVFFNDREYGVNWDGLARCESTNNPRATNPSGKYTGLFQFDDRTWASVGGSGRAYDASPEEQLMRAKMLFLQRGLQPWACAHAAR